MASLDRQSHLAMAFGTCHSVHAMAHPRPRPESLASGSPKVIHLTRRCRRAQPAAVREEVGHWIRHPAPAPSRNEPRRRISGASAGPYDCHRPVPCDMPSDPHHGAQRRCHVRGYAEIINADQGFPNHRGAGPGAVRPVRPQCRHARLGRHRHRSVENLPGLPRPAVRPAGDLHRLRRPRLLPLRRHRPHHRCRRWCRAAPSPLRPPAVPARGRGELVRPARADLAEPRRRIARERTTPAGSDRWDGVVVPADRRAGRQRRNQDAGGIGWDRSRR
jgi:hypothetical protein